MGEQFYALIVRPYCIFNNCVIKWSYYILKKIIKAQKSKYCRKNHNDRKAQGNTSWSNKMHTPATRQDGNRLTDFICISIRKKPARTNSALFLGLVALCLTSCLSGGQDPFLQLGADRGQGPQIIFDPLANPQPEIPLPNDLVTVVDRTSPTGLRLNITTHAPTQFEQYLRKEMDQLDGFGTFAPITIRFDKPLDLSTLRPGTIRLFNIDPASPHFGEEVILEIPEDLSHTAYPVEFTPWAFPPYSIFADAKQVVFNPAYGDVGDPQFTDIYEAETNTLFLRVLVPLDQQTQYMAVVTKDLTGLDGQPIRSPFKDIVYHTTQRRAFERTVPMLAKRGIPTSKVSFAWSFTTQTVTRDLEAIADGMHGRGPLAHLKTQYPPEITGVANMETTLDTLFCLNDPTWDNPCLDNIFILQAEFLDLFMGIMLGGFPDMVLTFAILAMEVDLGEGVFMDLPIDQIDYFVFGTYRSINFLDAEDGMFRMDYRTGQASTEAIDVPFLISIPKPTAEHKPPFPVVIHAHGMPSFRWESMATANTWAKQGYASACLDAPLHSPIITPDDIQVMTNSIMYDSAVGACGNPPDPECLEDFNDNLDNTMNNVGAGFINLVNWFMFRESTDEPPASFDLAMEAFLDTGFFAQLMIEGRAEDIDADGNTDHGALITADMFKTRDRFRQTIIDHMQFLQMLKALDPSKVPPEVQTPQRASEEVLMPNLLAGDFNADGILDLGGKYRYDPDDGLPSTPVGKQKYHRDGISFGGMTNSILLAIEPEEDVKSSSVNVPGGGLIDIFMRSDLRAVINRSYHEVLGPIIVGEPLTENILQLFFIRRGKKNLVSMSDQPATQESLMTSVLPCALGGGGKDTLQYDPMGYIDFLNVENGEEARIVREQKQCGAIEDCRRMDPSGAFSMGIPSDKGDRIEITSYNAAKQKLDQIEAYAINKGLGLQRNSPDFRRFMALGQIILEPGDPINYARHWFSEPLDPAKGRTAKNIHFDSIPGDMYVPFNTQIALARTAGLLGSESPHCDGYPGNLSECGTLWEDISKDCDCINLFWKQKDVMTGFSTLSKPRYNLDGLSPNTAECQNHTIPAVNNRHKGAGLSVIRFPYTSVWINFGHDEPVNRGMHWYMVGYNPEEQFRWGQYTQNQMAEFFITDGYSLQEPLDLDCPCPLDAETCRFITD